MHSTLEHPVFL